MSLIITPAEIAAATSLSTTEQDVQTAQDVVELFAGYDLSDALVTAEFGPGDLRRLRLAVQWQAVYLAAHPDILTREQIIRATANGASIERDGDGLLAPLAARCLNQLSWSAGTVHVKTLTPTRNYCRTQPDPWVRIA